MSTTSLKLSDDLKKSIQDIAEQDGVSTHAFMLRTMEQEVRRRRQRADFEAEAEAAAAATNAGAPVYSVDEVERYLKDKLRARSTGKKVTRPHALVDAPVSRAGTAPAKASRQRA
ncbi:hypothetical protein BH11PSE13_BH11PSE13_26160 [soil metagenome]